MVVLRLNTTKDGKSTSLLGPSAQPSGLVQHGCHPACPAFSEPVKSTPLCRADILRSLTQQLVPAMQANQTALVTGWSKLLATLSQDPITRFRLMLDPFTELDRLYIQWDDNQTNGLLGQGDLYLSIFDSLYQINPHVLFFVQAGAR